MKISAILIGATALLMSFVPQPLAAVYRQPAQSDEDYRLHGSRYSAVCWIETPGASGTLIAPTWVLTAAHYMSEGRPRSGDVVRFGVRVHAVKRVIVHPEYPARPGADLALLELVEPVTRITPVELNGASEELQQLCTLVGYGWTGIIKPGAPSASHSENFEPIKRAGTNVISRISGDWIFTRISGSSTHTGPTQDAAVGVGDSGGPLLAERKGRLTIVGVVAGYELGTENESLGRKNSEDQYVRVSKYTNWIEATTGQSFGTRRVQNSILWLLILKIVSCFVAIVFLARRWKRGKTKR